LKKQEKNFFFLHRPSQKFEKFYWEIKKVFEKSGKFRTLTMAFELSLFHPKYLIGVKVHILELFEDNIKTDRI